MKVHKIAEYSVKPEELDTVLKAIENFVEEVRNNEPQTNYQAYQLSENNSQFIHIMSFMNSEAEEKHKNATYTLAFADVLYPRCDQQPVFRDMNSISLTLGEGVVDWAN